MKTSKIVEYASFGALGVLTSAVGFPVLSWEFWAFMVVLMVATSAARVSGRNGI